MRRVRTFALSAYIFLVYAGSVSAQTPALVQAKMTSLETAGTITDLQIDLPQATIAGNALILFFQTDTTAGLSFTISDTGGDTFTAGPTRSGGQILRSYFALNIAAGSNYVKISITGGAPSFVSAAVLEYKNIATSAATDGNCNNGGAGTTITCGAFSTGTSGDLIAQFSVQDSVASPITSWTKGSGWTARFRDILDSQYVQWQVQGSAGSINPTHTMSPSHNWDTLALALKPATSGGSNSGIYAAAVQSESIPCGLPNSSTVQFSTSGNLIVLDAILVPPVDISSVTDGTNTYTSTGALFDNGSVPAGGSKRFHADNVTAGDYTLTITFTGELTCSGGSNILIYDFAGAAASPYDSTAGRTTTTGNQTSTSASYTGPSFTPTSASEAVLCAAGVEFITTSGISAGNFNSDLPTPLSNPDTLNQNNGWSLHKSSGNTTYTWSETGTGGVGHYESTCDAFQAPAAGGGTLKNLPLLGVGK